MPKLRDAELVLSLQPGSASFKILRLDGMTHQTGGPTKPMMLSALLNWSDQLVDLSISLPHRSWEPRVYGATGRRPIDYQNCLLSRNDSLVRLDIQDVNTFNWGLGDFCLDSFRCLVSLRLSTTFTKTATNHVANLLGPMLQEFRWNVVSDELWGFQRPEERWIRALATAAAERGSRLKKIHVEYSPHGLGWGGSDGHDSDSEFLYPWDRLERLALELLALGIRLTYTSPTRTRLQLQHMREMRHEELADLRQYYVSDGVCGLTAPLPDEGSDDDL